MSLQLELPMAGTDRLQSPALSLASGLSLLTCDTNKALVGSMASVEDY